jgi:hypothetical protein
MSDQNGSIKIEGIISEFKENNEGNLEIFLKVDSYSNLPKLDVKENAKLLSSINEIKFLTYPILDNEETPKLNNSEKIKAWISYSMNVLKENSFKLNGSLINYLKVSQEDGKEENYFPLEM